MLEKFRIGKHWGVRYSTKNGERICYFYKDGFHRKKTPFGGNPDPKANIKVLMGKTKLEQRMNANVCEWCGKYDEHCEVHHVNKLKNLKGKEPWEKLMLARKRKTMVLCHECHNKVAHPHL